MSTFERYYQDLLEWEGVAFTSLIAEWSDTDAQAIANDFTQAIASTSVKGAQVSIRPGSSNQSIGNQVEEFFVGRVSGALKQFRILDCSGHGYPDKQLHEQSTRKRFPLELKATSQWNPSDSNRRVLTSSSKKLRESFTAPIHHVLLTVCYDVTGAVYRILRVRLDFIQPSPEVSVRLEASVNHKILSSGHHTSRTI
jgi:hypothetical protein